MHYLILAVLSSTLINVFMHLSESRAENRTTMLSLNYLMCALLSFLYAKPHVLVPSGEGLPGVAALGAVSGVLYLVSFLLLKWNVSKNGIVLPATFMKLGVLVPTLLSIVIYNESLTLPRGAGFLLSIAAIVLLNKKTPGSIRALPGFSFCL